jgi:RimJ/RimL family protein N-acetyltransferase
MFLTLAGAWAIQGFAMFSVIEKASGAWVGRVGPWQPEGWPGTEVRWASHAIAAGSGYATEAATAAIDWAFDALRWSEVIHVIDVGNAASQAVAQARLAQPRARPAAGALQAVVIDVWGQTRAEWLARR